MSIHALSFDLENWYDGTLHREHYRGPRDDRVVAETEWLLETLARHRTRVTFFVLGRVALQHPGLVTAAAAAGHEIACHGFDHSLLYQMSPAEFRADLRRSRSLLQALSSQPVLGFRAPTWSLDQRALAWAPQIIAEEGFGYDSSVFPMRTPFYGFGAPRSPWRHPVGIGGLPELPPAVARFGPLLVPFGGGIYWRLLPVGLVSLLMARCSGPCLFYLHPWELNPAPVAAGPEIPPLARWVLKTGVKGAGRSLEWLLARHRFGPIAEVFANHMGEEVPTCLYSPPCSAPALKLPSA